MTMLKTAPIIAAGMALSACATTMPADGIEERVVGGGGACSAEDGQRFVGTRASAETGGAILRATGANSLRWGPPNAVFTMDYRTDRVNVMYDSGMTITEVRCG